MQKPRKKTRILFDANPIAQSGKSGVGYYTYRLIEALAKNYPDDLEIVGHYYNFLGRKKELDLPSSPNISYRTTNLIPGKVFNALRRKLGVEIPIEILARSRGDILLFPNFALLPSLYRKPRIGIIHDLYYLENPDHIQAKNLQFLRRYVPKTAKQADLVITVSHFSKQALIKNFDIEKEKILVTHIPPQTVNRTPKTKAREILNQIGVTKKFVLAIGTLEPRKNFKLLIDAYTRLDEELRKRYSLVIAGGGGWRNDDLIGAINNARNMGTDIITPGYVTDEQKNALYSMSTLVAVPSLYEGFGMQILEAMQAHSPVLVSDIPVFHEVAGNAVVYADPLDAPSIASGLSSILNDKSLQKTLKQNGIEQLSKYSWDKTAGDVYSQIARLHNG